MAEGRIKWYSEKKGYGFIEADNEDLLFLSEGRKGRVHQALPVYLNPNPSPTILPNSHLAVL